MTFERKNKIKYFRLLRTKTKRRMLFNLDSKKCRIVSRATLDNPRSGVAEARGAHG